MPATLPVGGLTVASLGLTFVVLGNAFYQKKQFYPSVVYITKSNSSLAAIYFLAFTLVILFGKLLKKVFFGQLRAAEFEQLLERSFYAVTETCLAFTVFREDFSPKFVSLFTVLLFVKAFHYLTDSRVDFMERSPVITMLFHIRVTSLLLFLMSLDLLLLNHSYLSTIAHGASVQIVFGFEYGILLTVGFNIAVKYICHTIDLRSENPWENKAVYLLYTELFVGLIKVILYVIFLIIMIRIHTFPLFIIRPMYLTMRSFKSAMNDVVQSRRAIHNMNTLYPDASAEELSAVDNVCIICREEMNTGAKKLPCGHIFHASCLRSWFQRQQTCPTCRMDILQQAAPLQNQFRHRHNAGANQQQPQAQQQPNAAGVPPLANFFAGFPFVQNLPQGVRPPNPFAAFPFIQQQLQQQQQQQQRGATADQSATSAGTSATGQNSGTAGAASTAANNAQGGTRGFPFPSMPAFSPFLPFGIPMPAPPAGFETMTLEELNAMEGTERRNVEARIKVLRNVQTLLDAASVQLSQYNSVVSNLEAQAAVAHEAAKKMEQEKKNGDKKEGGEKADAVKGAEGGGGSTVASTGDACNNPKTTTMTRENKEKNTEKSDDSTLIPPACSTSSSSTLKDPPAEQVSTEPPLEGSLSSEKTPPLDSDDPNEIRRRRLEKFSASTSCGNPQQEET